jgi:hypothetical protein
VLVERYRHAAFLGAVKDLLRNELAVPRKHVHTERYD